MKKTLLSALLLFILITGLITLRFGSALVQEGNPLPILISIMRLELSDSEYEQVEESKSSHQHVSLNTGDSSYDVIKDFMDEKGWSYKEQIGSGYIFENGEETVVISTRQYSRNYFLWDIPSELFN
ncbi:hypothetical protein [Psychrobacillus sp. MER TA 171]|uniref:hypothetical protein n=1 Tax=Psychrobacillus sp. MER TA 171 TaxID=2939577 RepID=UPI00203A7DC5|nr:hypothetical protein [Psychrobacillus sp. MER TA 171]MCM3359261.1 hypothetical protein [Psychrobacillus sp. MER TA 171]